MIAGMDLSSPTVLWRLLGPRGALARAVVIPGDPQSTLTVFVNDDYVFLLEAGGTKELVTRHEDQINWSVSNFLPD